ncbi:MAG: hypothetical protein Sapg2KO_17060 [Saprospiraceae bacterium]
MNKLSELIKLVSPNKIKQISILSPSLSKHTKLVQLYQGIYTQKFQTDADAIKVLYGLGPVGSKYSKLKNDLETRLLNVLLASDLTNSQMNARQKAYFKYFKIWAAANILIRLGIINYSTRILEKTLKHFEKNEFTSLSLETSMLLRNHYYRHLGNAKKGAFYNKKTNLLLAQYNAEIVLSGYMEQIVVHYVKEKGDNSHLDQVIDEFITKAKEILPKETNATIIYRMKMLEVTKCMNLHNYEATAKICEEVVAYFEEYKQHFRTYIIIFINQWIISCTQLKAYKKATELVQKALTYLQPGEFNWFKLMEYRTQLAFYKQDYTTAYKTYRAIIRHSNFLELPDPVQEEWRLYEAYAQFVFLAGQVEGPKNGYKKFKVHKFLNDIFIFSQDKKGLNIPILVIYLCYLLMYQKYNTIIDKMEGLEKYRQRYLSTEKHKRSNIFIKILLLFFKNNFDAKVANKEVQPHLDELSKYPFNILTSDHELEIIPYEHLWNIILCLKKTGYPAIQRRSTFQ